MKKVTIFTVLVILLSLSVLSVSAAWSGVEGKVFAADGSEWQYGGTVIAYADPGTGYIDCGSDTFAAESYSITFTCTPADFTTIYLEFTFNPGDNGTPPIKTEVLANLSSSSGVATVNTTTQTGPTAVTLADITPTQSTAALPTIAALFLVMSSMSFFLLRRRRQTV
jgi:hypothetical protein